MNENIMREQYIAVIEDSCPNPEAFTVKVSRHGCSSTVDVMFNGFTVYTKTYNSRREYEESIEDSLNRLVAICEELTDSAL